MRISSVKLSSQLYRVPPFPAGGTRGIPLKLKWGKKSGRYDLSQDIFVLTVNVGDHLLIQCTLNTESTATECMNYIRQKCDLNQIDLFGLRFPMKAADPDERIMRWVEMDKPLRKQLEKWACKPRQVQLAILYHTPNAFTLTDQTARSFYFLLTKLDVVEGRLTVDMEKYITLAAYSLQVEYGDYDQSVHTIDFMQTIPLLPKHICRSATILEDLLKRVLQVYEKLRGMKSSYAALLYIVDAMQCEGYGEEYFKGKDENSAEVRVGYSPDGFVIHTSYGAPIKYEWETIKEVAHHKRHLQLMLTDQRLVEFTMEDVEMARYVSMVFTWQLHYATHKAIDEKNAKNDINDLQGGIKTFTNHHQSNTELNNTRLNVSQSDLQHTMRGDLSDRSTSNRQINSLVDMSHSLSNLNSVPSDRKYPLSSVSFRTPMTVAVPSPERARAATSACYPQQLAQVSPQQYQQTASQMGSQHLSSQRSSQSQLLTQSQLIMGSQSILSSTGRVGSQMGLQSVQTGSQQTIPTSLVSLISHQNNGTSWESSQQHPSGQEVQMGQMIPLWHPNVIDDKNASYKALYPFAVEIGGNHPNNQRRPSASLSTNLSPQKPQQKKMGSLPEMRLLGTNNEETVAFVRDILQRADQDILCSPARRDVSEFQSAPNLAEIQKRQHQLTTVPIVLPQNIPPEPATYHPILLPRQPLQASTSNAASVSPTKSTNNNNNEERPSTNCPSAQKPSTSSSMRLFEENSNRGTARHTLLNGVAQNDGEILGDINENLVTMVDAKLNCSNDVFRAEFMRIPMKKMSAGTSTSLKPENLCRNRTKSIVPYEDNRVMLSPCKANPTGYINASNVEVLVGGQKLQYILTQAPLRDTVDDFWASVWESGCQVIVMLSEAKLDDLQSAPIYWPTNASSKVETRDLVVKFKTMNVQGPEATTILEVRNKSCGGRRTIYHMRFSGWQTGDVPSAKELLAFMDSVSSVRRYLNEERGRTSSVGSRFSRKTHNTTTKNLHDVSNRLQNGPLSWKKRINSNSTTQSHASTLSIDSSDSGAPPSPTATNRPSPLLIHCHYGSHESGVYLLAEVLIFCVQHNLNADVPVLLQKLRAQRMSLVKGVEQYKFVYTLVKMYIDQTRLI